MSRRRAALGPQEKRGFIRETTQKSRTQRRTPADGSVPEGPQGLSPGRNKTSSQFTQNLLHIRNQPHSAVADLGLRQQRNQGDKHLFRPHSKLLY
eukprot:8427247-Pyramimonas_sp.AAC.1